MQAILDIAERVRSRVEASHGEVLTRALDVLDRRLGLAEQNAQRCSYGAVLGDYTHFNISIHHCTKLLDENGFFEQYSSRLKDAERRVRGLRVGMYDNVCLDCAACKSRHKPWPSHTHFINPPPVDTKINSPLKDSSSLMPQWAEGIDYSSVEKRIAATMEEAARDITSVNRMSYVNEKDFAGYNPQFIAVDEGIGPAHAAWIKEGGLRTYPLAESDQKRYAGPTKTGRWSSRDFGHREVAHDAIANAKQWDWRKKYENGIYNKEAPHHVYRGKMADWSKQAVTGEVTLTFTNPSTKLSQELLDWAKQNLRDEAEIKKVQRHLENATKEALLGAA